MPLYSTTSQIPERDVYYQESFVEGESAGQRCPPPSSAATTLRHSGGSDQSPSTEQGSPKTLLTQSYHVFDVKTKRLLVFLVSLAGIFSPLSSNIYIPALGAISKGLNVSGSQINLSITIYMIFQGLAPSFWGAAADTRGRRPVYIGTLLLYLIANIGLSLCPSYEVLMIFRGLQAAGSSATIALGAGVISDMSTPAERGGYIGTFAGGPVLGGALTQQLGFRAIFQFLLILNLVVLVIIVIILPETLRTIAGNGSIRLHGVYRPLAYKFIKEPTYLVDADHRPSTQKFSLSAIFEPLKFLFEKDVFITLLFGSIVYTVWSMITASTTAMFQRRYNLNDFLVGLAFLPNGAGCMLGSYITGVIMDRDYQRTAEEYRRKHHLPEGTKVDKNELDDFPIERARNNVWWVVAIFFATVAAYGWSVGKHIAVPLVLQFFIAYTATAVFNLNSVLMVDLYPGKAASATAVNNLARCSVGAAGVAVIKPLRSAVGNGPAFSILAGVAVALSPLLVVEWVFGMRWRVSRMERLREKDRAMKEEFEMNGSRGGNVEKK
ncbi:MAG: hypothetical protein M1830_005891 [Pleopsidium flavum]|nr:MAG: hypothetical protein M1830_005891 [Pleopsidium flavum]